MGTYVHNQSRAWTATDQVETFSDYGTAKTLGAAYWTFYVNFKVVSRELARIGNAGSPSDKWTRI